jgi:MerR family transcriptional regulator/heat shock protein HspR
MSGDKDVKDIAEICRRLGIQPVELEAMEEEGLITLAALRDEKALPSDQLDRLEMILRLQRDLSINLAGIDVILEMRDKMIQMRKEVDDILEFIRRQISRDLREMLGEEDFPMALGPGDKFLSIGRGISGRGDAGTRGRGGKDVKRKKD